MEENSDILFDELFQDYKNRGDIQEFGKVIGRGGYGRVRDVKYKNKSFAGKLFIKNNYDESKEISDLRGPNIIKIQKICEPRQKDGNTYQLILMEKAILRDLGKLNQYLHEKNLLRLIFDHCFDEPLSDSLLRFYCKQIVRGLECLYKNNYVHFDIKPDNILIASNLVLKISDFSTLRKISDDVDEIKIPGGTPGYLSPEYYSKEKVPKNSTQKQDFFALGATLFYLKFGKSFMKYHRNKENNEENKKLTADLIIDLLMKNINYINSQKLLNGDLIHFLTKLIQFTPEERYSFKNIYRNKWLNKDLDLINYSVGFYEMDEEKLLIELQKQDFFKQKKQIFKYNKKIMETNNSKRIMPKKINIGKKFKIKKSIFASK